MDKPEPGSRWKHFRGGEYIVETVAADCDDETPLVIYTSVETHRTWARRLDDWHVEVSGKEGPVPRFTLVRLRNKTQTYPPRPA